MPSSSKISAGRTWMRMDGLRPPASVPRTPAAIGQTFFSRLVSGLRSRSLAGTDPAPSRGGLCGSFPVAFTRPLNSTTVAGAAPDKGLIGPGRLPNSPPSLAGRHLELEGDIIIGSTCRIDDIATSEAAMTTKPQTAVNRPPASQKGNHSLRDEISYSRHPWERRYRAGKGKATLFRSTG